MSEEIKPALTAEEWARRDVDRPHDAEDGLQADDWPRLRLTQKGITVGEFEREQMRVAAELCPALAALALQLAGPDGGPLFTWEMVDALRTAAMGYISGDFNGYNDWNEAQADLLDRAADALAPLLPPRKEP